MRKQGSGAIVNNSSIGGLIGSRAGIYQNETRVIGLTKSAALEYAPEAFAQCRVPRCQSKHRWLRT